MVRCRSCTYPNIHVFMALTLKITVGWRSCTDPSIFEQKKTGTHMSDSLVRTTREWRAVGTSTRADACACASDPQLSSPCRRFRTGETPWSVFQAGVALGGLLAAQAHATQVSLHPAVAGTSVASLCVEPFVHRASDRQRAEAQDVGHSHDVLSLVMSACDNLSWEGM